MEIKHIKEGDSLTIVVSGRLDTVTSSDLESFIRDNIEGIKHLTFDLKEMDYTSSAGLRVFLITQKLMSSLSGEMILLNVQKDVMEVFDITGFSDILDIR